MRLNLLLQLMLAKMAFVGVLLQEDTFGSLRPCAYWARKLKDCETRYSAYDREALAVVEVLPRLWKVYLLGCKHFYYKIMRSDASMQKGKRAIT
jgi:hypothetical protein